MRPRSRYLAALALLGLASCASKLDDDRAWEPPDYFAQECYADVNGARICYLEAGEEHEETLVFVHGWSGNVHNWWDQFEHFAGEYHVLVFDLPGHGKSEKGDHLEYDMDLWVSTVAGMMDHRSIEDAIVVGNSAGGNIAARFAIAHPERVRMLVLADPTGSGRDGKIAWVKPAITPRALNVAGLTTGEHFPGEDPKSRARAEMIRSYVGTSEERPYLEALAEGFGPSYEKIPTQQLAQIRVPTLILWGDEDPVVPKRAIRPFQEHIGDTKTVWVQGAGHNPNTEAPKTFNCVLGAFIEGRPVEGCEGGVPEVDPDTRLSGPSSKRTKR